MDQIEKFIIFGFGLVGPMLAIELNNKFPSKQIMIYDKLDYNDFCSEFAHPEPPKSINMTIGERGLDIIDRIFGNKDFSKELKKTPVEGRAYHDEYNEITTMVYQEEYKGEGEQLYSFSRKKLRKILQEEVIKRKDKIKICYQTKLTEETVSSYTDDKSLVFCCDGIYSPSRNGLILPPDEEIVEVFDYYYFQISVEKNLDLDDYLHIWKREHSLLIGFPNEGEGFTFNLFLSKKAYEDDFKVDYAAFFSYIKESHEDLSFSEKEPIVDFYNPNELKTFLCPEWYKNNCCLLGDSAHALTPFLGIGFTLGLEDIIKISELMYEGFYNNKSLTIEKIMKKYQRDREACTDAAAEMCEYNFQMLSKTDHDWGKIDMLVEEYQKENELFLTIYELIEFTKIPISLCMEIYEEYQKTLLPDYDEEKFESLEKEFSENRKISRYYKILSANPKNKRLPPIAGELKKLEFFYRILEEFRIFFCELEMEEVELDPIIGDSSCQITAIAIWFLRHNNTDKIGFGKKEDIEEIKIDSDKFLEETNVNFHKLETKFEKNEVHLLSKIKRFCQSETLFLREHDKRNFFKLLEEGSGLHEFIEPSRKAIELAEIKLSMLKVSNENLILIFKILTFYEDQLIFKDGCFAGNLEISVKLKTSLLFNQTKEFVTRILSSGYHEGFGNVDEGVFEFVGFLREAGSYNSFLKAEEFHDQIPEHELISPFSRKVWDVVCFHPCEVDRDYFKEFSSFELRGGFPCLVSMHFASQFLIIMDLVNHFEINLVLKYYVADLTELKTTDSSSCINFHYFEKIENKATIFFEAFGIYKEENEESLKEEILLIEEFFEETNESEVFSYFYLTGLFHYQKGSTRKLLKSLKEENEEIELIEFLEPNTKEIEDIENILRVKYFIYFQKIKAVELNFRSSFILTPGIFEELRLNKFNLQDDVTYTETMDFDPNNVGEFTLTNSGRELIDKNSSITLLFQHCYCAKGYKILEFRDFQQYLIEMLFQFYNIFKPSLIEESNQKLDIENLIKEILPSVTEPIESSLSLNAELELVESIPAKEYFINEDELREILKNEKFPVALDGFEPSGRMHIAQGILRVVNCNKLIDAGCLFIFWIADIFASLNRKFGGDMEKIEIVGCYFLEIWESVGLKMNNVRFIWAGDEIKKDMGKYWSYTLDIAKNFSVERVKKCLAAAGREFSEEIDTAQMIYPLMQCADAFYLGIDILSSGTDQIKVNNLIKQYSKLKDQRPPIVLSHQILITFEKLGQLSFEQMILGLKKNQIEMSKSDLSSAIYMEDTFADILAKIFKGYCPWLQPAQEKLPNPILDYIENIIFEKNQKFSLYELQAIEYSEEFEQSFQKGEFLFEIDSLGKFNLYYEGKFQILENETYYEFRKLEIAYYKGDISPLELELSLCFELENLILPVRYHFETNKRANFLKNLVKEYAGVYEKKKNTHVREEHQLKALLSYNRVLIEILRQYEKKKISTIIHDVSFEEQLMSIHGNILSQTMKEEKLLEICAKIFNLIEDVISLKKCSGALEETKIIGNQRFARSVDESIKQSIMEPCNMEMLFNEDPTRCKIYAHQIRNLPPENIILLVTEHLKKEWERKEPLNLELDVVEEYKEVILLPWLLKLEEFTESPLVL